MGNCDFKSYKETVDNNPVNTKNLYVMQYIVGKGGFGKVWKVEFKKTKEIYAMKIMSKFKIYQKKSVISVLNEKKLLENLSNPFIVNIHYAFQDKENLYLTMDYLGGGDLRYHLIKNIRFTEEKTKFIIACLLCALEYIHNKTILHRDIKPENLVFDDCGYIRLTDFGISRIWSPKNENDTSGTPGYMAPEVIMKQGHGIACDLFAVGVIAYECMLGKRPYNGYNRKEIKENMLAKQAKISVNDKPSNWSDDSVDFINKLLIRKHNQRLGNDKPGSAKNHPWFNGYDWKNLNDKKITSPFQGIKIDDSDYSHFGKSSTVDDNNEEKVTFFRNQQIQKLFIEYTFDKSKQSKESFVNTKIDFNNMNTDKTTKMTTLNSVSKLS